MGAYPTTLISAGAESLANRKIWIADIERVNKHKRQVIAAVVSTVLAALALAASVYTTSFLIAAPITIIASSLATVTAFAVMATVAAIFGIKQSRTTVAYLEKRAKAILQEAYEKDWTAKDLMSMYSAEIQKLNLISAEDLVALWQEDWKNLTLAAFFTKHQKALPLFKTTDSGKILLSSKLIDNLKITGARKAKEDRLTYELEDKLDERDIEQQGADLDAKSSISLEKYMERNGMAVPSNAEAKDNLIKKVIGYLKSSSNIDGIFTNCLKLGSALGVSAEKIAEHAFGNEYETVLRGGSLLDQPKLHPALLVWVGAFPQTKQFLGKKLLSELVDSSSGRIQVLEKLEAYEFLDLDSQEVDAAVWNKEKRHIGSAAFYMLRNGAWVASSHEEALDLQHQFIMGFEQDLANAQNCLELGKALGLSEKDIITCVFQKCVNSLKRGDISYSEFHERIGKTSLALLCSHFSELKEYRTKAALKEASEMGYLEGFKWLCSLPSLSDISEQALWQEVWEREKYNITDVEGYLARNGLRVGTDSLHVEQFKLLYLNHISRCSVSKDLRFLRENHRFASSLDIELDFLTNFFTPILERLSQKEISFSDFLYQYQKESISLVARLDQLGSLLQSALREAKYGLVALKELRLVLEITEQETVARILQAQVEAMERKNLGFTAYKQQNYSIISDENKVRSILCQHASELTLQEFVALHGQDAVTWLDDEAKVRYNRQLYQLLQGASYPQIVETSRKYCDISLIPEQVDALLAADLEACSYDQFIQKHGKISLEALFATSQQTLSQKLVDKLKRIPVAAWCELDEQMLKLQINKVALALDVWKTRGLDIIWRSDRATFVNWAQNEAGCKPIILEGLQKLSPSQALERYKELFVKRIIAQDDLVGEERALEWVCRGIERLSGADEFAERFGSLLAEIGWESALSLSLQRLFLRDMRKIGFYQFTQDPARLAKLSELGLNVLCDKATWLCHQFNVAQKIAQQEESEATARAERATRELKEQFNRQRSDLSSIYEKQIQQERAKFDKTNTACAYQRALASFIQAEKGYQDYQTEYKGWADQLQDAQKKYKEFDDNNKRLSAQLEKLTRCQVNHQERLEEAQKVVRAAQEENKDYISMPVQGLKAALHGLWGGERQKMIERLEKAKSNLQAIQDEPSQIVRLKGEVEQSCHTLKMQETTLQTCTETLASLKKHLEASQAECQASKIRLEQCTFIYKQEEATFFENENELLQAKEQAIKSKQMETDSRIQLSQEFLHGQLDRIKHELQAKLKLLEIDWQGSITHHEGDLQKKQRWHELNTQRYTKVVTTEARYLFQPPMQPCYQEIEPSAPTLDAAFLIEHPAASPMEVEEKEVAICPISLDVLEVGDKKAPCCGQVFKKEKIEGWLTLNPTCPCCRNELGASSLLSCRQEDLDRLASN